MGAFVDVHKILRCKSDYHLIDSDRHLSYLQNRPGQDRLVCESRPIFNSQEDQVSADIVFRKIESGPHVPVAVYRVLVAPNCAHLDAKSLTRKIFAEYKKYTGIELEWYAVVHDNTKNSHTHLLIMPTDARNKSFLVKNISWRLLKESADNWIAEHAKKSAYSHS